VKSPKYYKKTKRPYGALLKYAIFFSSQNLFSLKSLVGATKEHIKTSSKILLQVYLSTFVNTESATLGITG